MFSAQLKADSDSGVTQTKKTSYVGKPLAKLSLLTSVGETDSDYGVTWTEKKQATWGNTLQYFGCLLQLVKLTLILERPGPKNNIASLSSTNTKVSAIY